MSNSNRTFRERMMDRVVLRYLGLIMFVTVLCPLANSQLIVPYVIDTIPLYPDNPACTNLPAPLGGNNRSLLAYNNNGNDALEFDLSLSKSDYIIGDNIRLTLTVKNKDRGPVVFMLPSQSPIIVNQSNLPANQRTVQGLMFEILPPSGQFFDDRRTYQPAGIIPADQLHLIGSGSRCKQTYTIDWATLQQLGGNLGDYRIRVAYRNNYPGGAEEFTGQPSYYTQVPEYATDQGIWMTEGVTSNEVRFSVVPQPTPRPPQ